VKALAPLQSNMSPLRSRWLGHADAVRVASGGALELASMLVAAEPAVPDLR